MVNRICIEKLHILGLDSSPASVSGRVLAGTFLLFCVLFYQYYSGSIVSALLFEPPKSILTVKALFESNLQIGMNPRPYAVDWLSVRFKKSEIISKPATKVFTENI